MHTDAISIDSSGESRPLELDDGSDVEAQIRQAHAAGGFVWYSVDDPDEERMRELAERFGLHPLAAADAASGKQQPKIQQFPQHLFIVMWTLVPGEELPIGQLFLFLREGLLLCVQRTPKEESRLDVRAIVENREIDTGAGVMAAAYRIMATVASDYTDYGSAVEDELEELERQAFDREIREDTARIYALRQRVGKVVRAVATFAAALDAGRGYLEELVIDEQKLGPYLRDLYGDVAATAALAEDQRQALDGVIASHENNVAMRQNSDMRKISAIAALLGIPTVVAGLYGMNFKNIPLVQWQYGWVVIGVAIVVIDIVVYVLFKRRRWL